MQGKKYDAATKEQALAMLAVSTSIQEVSDKLHIPFSTLKTWKDAAEKDDDEFVKLRNEKKSVLCMGASYKTLAACQKAVDSTYRFCVTAVADKL